MMFIYTIMISLQILQTTLNFDNNNVPDKQTNYLMQN